MTAPRRVELRRAAAASNRRLWSRYRFEDLLALSSVHESGIGAMDVPL